MSTAAALAGWASNLEPTEDDLALAERALLDTVAVALAARGEPVLRRAGSLSEVARWAVVSHILDFDDLHMPSTTHISTVCLPAALAVAGDAHAYLAGAGVMARLGTALGWPHYSAGWHATTTAGAPSAAIAAGVALGLDAERLATAMALAIPAAGGVQRAFGTDAKPLQVGFAADAGVRAAELAAHGATADIGAVDTWLELVGGEPTAALTEGPAVPGGLAIKIFPCCYALQRPISALAELAQQQQLDARRVDRVLVRTPKGTVTPLIHHCPETGLQGKFSLEYAVAVALLDSHPGLSSFTDEAVQRPEAQRLVRRVQVELSDGGDWLLAGELEAEIWAGDQVWQVRQQFPPGSPQRPPTDVELERKMADCLAGSGVNPNAITWSTAVEILRAHL